MRMMRISLVQHFPQDFRSKTSHLKGNKQKLKMIMIHTRSFVSHFQKVLDELSFVSPGHHYKDQHSLLDSKTKMTMKLVQKRITKGFQDQLFPRDIESEINLLNGDCFRIKLTVK